MKTKYVSAVIIVATCLVGSMAISDPVEQISPSSRIGRVVRKHYPDAVIAQDNSNLTVKYGTMVFTIHQEWKTGEVIEETRQVEGPNFKGFILSLTVKEGSYAGQALVPQTLRRPYWQTYIDRPPTEDGKGHYVINFSYGSRLDRNFMKDIFEALPKSRTPTDNQ